MKILPVAVAAALCLSAACGHPSASTPYVDASVSSELNQISAIDNHAHPMAVVAAGEEDHNYDALSMEGIEDMGLPAPFREGSPYFPEAWHALYGVNATADGKQNLSRVEQLSHDMQKRKGDLFPAWVLNQSHTELMLANRVAMGRGLTPDRFKWVPFVDMFLFPLNNSALAAKDPDKKIFFAREQQLLQNYLKDAQLNRVPAAFDDYLTFVSHRLGTFKSAGAVALKFELAYLRDLSISDPQRETAERVYAIYSQSSEPSPEEYKLLQDFLFRYIAREAGRLDLPVHIHCALGGGSYFREANADPLLLEPLFNDPGLRKTKFVLLHGGYPFTREAAALILKPNVYLDYSAFMYLNYPVEGARAVRLYLESAPEKVLYGSDASPFTNNVGWAETDWIGAHLAREELGIALTGMMHDGEITLDRAKQIGHLVLRENARQLYGF
ncbi:MAG TPA: amidohydrolase family protein [Bryobacteraceae bacterium]|nr:amidohydrolase family protein [Bryobacteraceae bacterium]